MSVQTKEARIILTIDAIRTTQKLSRRRVATIYDIPETTLRDRIKRVTPKARSVNALFEFNDNRKGGYYPICF
jgi:hypothetical protein